MPTLSGFVHYSNGNPVSGAAVNYYTAIEGTPSSSLGSTTTNANGYWEFTGVALGLYDVRVTWDSAAQIRWHKGLSFSQNQGVSRTYDVVATDVPVSNTVTETNLYSATIDAATLSTYKAIEIDIVGELTVNAAGSNPIVRLKYGGTTLLEQAFGADISSSATARAFRVHAKLYATSASAQVAYMETLWGSPDSAAIGVGATSNPADATMVWGVANNIGTGAIDSTLDQTLAITWQWGAANAAITLTTRHCHVELL